MAERHDEIKSFCHEFSPLVVITLDLCKSGRYLLSNLYILPRKWCVLSLVFVFVKVLVSILFKATKSGSGSPSTSSRQVVQGKSLTSKKFKILKCQKTQKLFLAFFGETQGFTAILGKSQYPCSLGQQTRREGIRFLPVQRALCLEKTPDSTDSLNSFWYLELHTYQKDARISFKKVVDFSDGNVEDFFGANIADFFETKILANARCVKIYRKGAPVLHTNQKNAWISLQEVDQFF